MHRLSMVQALSLWSGLEDALNRRANYGGDVAEIYVYKCMVRAPMAEKYLDSASKTGSGMGRSEAIKYIQEANASFHNLLVHFAEERDARIEIEVYEGGSWTFKELGAWFATWEEGHRWHVRVRPRNPPKRIDDGDLLHLFDIEPDQGMPCGNWKNRFVERLEERDIDGLANIVFRVVDGKVRVYAATSKA
jgi:hypothetical protein